MFPQRFHLLIGKLQYVLAFKNDFSGNVIDVCPVGALTDKTFRFKSRVWYTKPVDAHRDCDKCCGKVRLWYKGDDVLRVTVRRDAYGEVQNMEDGKAGWICNSCRYDKKQTSDWTIEGPAHIDRSSVISANHYESLRALKKVTAKQLQSALPHGVKSPLGYGPLNPNNEHAHKG